EEGRPLTPTARKRQCEPCAAADVSRTDSSFGVTPLTRASEARGGLRSRRSRYAVEASHDPGSASTTELTSGPRQQEGVAFGGSESGDEMTQGERILVTATRAPNSSIPSITISPLKWLSAIWPVRHATTSRSPTISAAKPFLYGASGVPETASAIGTLMRICP